MSDPEAIIEGLPSGCLLILRACLRGGAGPWAEAPRLSLESIQGSYPAHAPAVLLADLDRLVGEGLIEFSRGDYGLTSNGYQVAQLALRKRTVSVGPPPPVTIRAEASATHAALRAGGSSDSRARSTANRVDELLLTLHRPMTRAVIKRTPRNKSAFETLEVENLYKEELPNFWRLLYTMNGTTPEIVAILSHADYDALFPNRGK